ncbi:MAG: ChaN family lipoprotein [Cytophagales bacterium]|nr:ChaN family lipoprotein [Bernardetiaceae bacterium]MDW8211342.1 ChaN family lipoprotein [Cytophagales bacterium]
MGKLWIALLVIFTTLMQDNPAYLLYDSSGKVVPYSQLLTAATKADVILFGESHNNPICHWLQLRLTKDLHKNLGNKLVLAAEMFEADDQLVLNEYLAGLIKENNFEKEAKIWNNYATDYKPLVNFAKQNHLAFIASNIPRRYAAMVAMQGLESLEKLEAEAKRILPPLPIPLDRELPSYKKIATMMGGHAGTSAENMVAAQAIKDATMGYRIAQAWEKGKVILHLNGSYHSDNYEGIVWYLNRYKPGLNLLTISISEQEDITALAQEAHNKAHFIVAVPADMTKTY